MKFEQVPVKNQKFDIGRTINFTKCDCEKCDFMHCPKNNYALKMQKKMYTVKEFWNENKDAIIKARALKEYFNFDTVSDFIDACITFPKGTYWEFDSWDGIELVTQNRSKHGPDFLRRAVIGFFDDFPIIYYVGATDTQEKLAEKIRKRLLELNELLRKATWNIDYEKQEVEDLCDMK